VCVYVCVRWVWCVAFTVADKVRCFCKDVQRVSVAFAFRANTALSARTQTYIDVKTHVVHIHSHHTPTHDLVRARTNLYKHNAPTSYTYIHTIHQRTALSAHAHTYTHMCTHTLTLHTHTQPCLRARKALQKRINTYSRCTHRYVATQGHGQS